MLQSFPEHVSNFFVSAFFSLAENHLSGFSFSSARDLVGCSNVQGCMAGCRCFLTKRFFNVIVLHFSWFGDTRKIPFSAVIFFSFIGISICAVRYLFSRGIDVFRFQPLDICSAGV